VTQLTFQLTPKAPVKVVTNKYLVLLQAYGVCVNHTTLTNIPGSLSQQYGSNVITIHYDPKDIAGDYPISQFRKHSSYLIGFFSYAQLHKEAEISLFITIRAQNTNLLKNAQGETIFPKVEVFAGDEFEEEYEITDGEREFIVEFDRPPNNTWIFIVIRPVTNYPYAFVKVDGRIAY
jgi:hypothetical protein